jgi:hypothetical protein
MDEDNEYEVGYKKPPKSTQFKRGRSGNPRGRPKGLKSTPALIRSVFGRKIQVKGPKGVMFMSMLEAGLTQLANKAATGDLRAIRDVVRLSQEIQDEQTLGPSPTFVVNFVKPEDVEE